MRPIHLGWAVLTLAILLACLGFWIGSPRFSVRAGSAQSALEEAEAAAAAGSISVEAGGADPAARGSTQRQPVESALAALRAEAEKRPPPPRPELTGRVVAPDGSGVVGATVFASKSSGWTQIPLDIEPEGLPKNWIQVETTATGAEGRFAFEGFKPGPLRLAVRADGFAPKYENRLTIPDVVHHDLGELRLERGVCLRGRVVDRTNKGIAGAALLAVLDGTSTTSLAAVPGRGIPLATSGAEGAFRVDQLAVGPWKLIVDAPGYQVLEAEGRTDRAGEESAGLVFRLEPGVDIAGRVRVAEQGLPPLPAGLRVTARPSPEAEGAPQTGRATGAELLDRPAPEVRARQALCDGEGRFVVSGLKPGTRYRLSLSQPSAEPSGWKRLVGIEPATAWAGERGVEILYTPESALVLRVVDDVSGAPLEQFTVAAGVGRERPLRDEKNEVLRDHPDGRVRYGDLRLAAGGKPVVLRICAAGYRDHEQKSIALAPGQTLELGEIRLVRERVAVVRVVDAATGEPVPLARVLLATQTQDGLASYFESDPSRDYWGDAKARFGRTGADGKVSLTGAPGKMVTVRADAKGFLPCEPLQTLLPADSDAALELRLPRGGTVVVRVTDGNGRPLAGIGIAHRKPGGDEDDEWIQVAQKTDEEGSARFEALPGGIHRFRVHDQASEWIDPESEASRAPWTQVLAADGTVVEIAMTAPPRGGIQGEIREGGHPMEGARLKLVEIRPGQNVARYWSGADDPLSTTTDHSGAYHYENLRCGTYMLVVNHPDRRMAARFEVEITPLPQTFDVDLDVASIEGRITDLEGRPVGGAEVMASLAKDELGDQQPHQMIVSEDDRGGVRVHHQQLARRSEKTDEQGRYVLRGLVSEAPIVVRVIGDVVEGATSSAITLARDDVQRGVDFALRLAGRITIRLADEPANKANWFEARALRLENGKETQVQNVQLGTWNREHTMRALAPGSYKIELWLKTGSGSGSQQQSREIEVAPGETALVVFQLR